MGGSLLICSAFRNWIKSLRKPARVAQARRKSFRPLVETMESRIVPATIYVGPGANRMYHTIQAGVNAANNGDKVVIDPGTYTEQVTINKNIEVRGTRATTIIQS